MRYCHNTWEIILFEETKYNSIFEFLYYVFLLIIFQKFNCSILSQIAGPIFGALIGAFAAWLLSYMNSQNEFNNNTEAIILVEKLRWEQCRALEIVSLLPFKVTTISRLVFGAVLRPVGERLVCQLRNFFAIPWKGRFASFKPYTMGIQRNPLKRIELNSL